MNIYDVSKKAGVSIATVSRVINGNANVSDKTRQKVLNVMTELGYTPNVFARGLGLNTMKTIGIMCADSSDPFLANAVYHLERNLRKNGYDSFLCCTGYELAARQNYLKLLLSKRVDAVILVGSNYLEPSKKDNRYIVDAAEEVPVMLINGYLSHPNIYCTLCDDYQAVYDNTRKLIRQGYQRPLFLYCSRSYSSLQKLSGFQDALAAEGLSAAEEYAQMCGNDIMQAKDLLLSLHSRGFLFDAVFGAEDVLAVGAVKYAGALGLRIPDDLAVIGYNNSILAVCSEPELTSIDNHVETLSLTTVATLMRVFTGSDAPNRTTISGELVRRRTTPACSDGDSGGQQDARVKV